MVGVQPRRVAFGFAVIGLPSVPAQALGDIESVVLRLEEAIDAVGMEPQRLGARRGLLFGPVGRLAAAVARVSSDLLDLRFVLQGVSCRYHATIICFQCVTWTLCRYLGPGGSGRNS